MRITRVAESAKPATGINTRRTHGASTICTATYGSGARTGMGIILPVQRVILSVLRMAPSASDAVVPGSARRTTPVPRFGSGSSPPAAATPWASAPVSDRPVSSGVSRREPPSRAEPARGATEAERSSEVFWRQCRMIAYRSAAIQRWRLRRVKLKPPYRP
jgi:hypothetical protein